MDVDGLGSVGAMLSLLSGLPAVVFLLDGIFLSGWRDIEKKHITGRGLFWYLVILYDIWYNYFDILYVLFTQDAYILCM